MTALIILLAGWRMARRTLLPPAIDVALDHVIWLRMRNPRMTPQDAGAVVGSATATWAEVVRAYAAAWESLPEEVRRAGNR